MRIYKRTIDLIPAQKSVATFQTRGNKKYPQNHNPNIQKNNRPYPHTKVCRHLSNKGEQKVPKQSQCEYIKEQYTLYTFSNFTCFHVFTSGQKVQYHAKFNENNVYFPPMMSTKF